MGNDIAEGPVISRRRPDWGPFLYILLLLSLLLLSSHVKTLCLFKKKEKERDVCVVLFLFVTGFTKLYFNKLLELLSSMVLCGCLYWDTERISSSPVPAVMLRRYTAFVSRSPSTPVPYLPPNNTHWFADAHALRAFVRNDRASGRRVGFLLNAAAIYFLLSLAGCGRKVGRRRFSVRLSGGAMGSRVLVPAVLLLLALVTVCAQTNSPQGRGFLFFKALRTPQNEVQ